jgi:hypothetical protein
VWRGSQTARYCLFKEAIHSPVSGHRQRERCAYLTTGHHVFQSLLFDLELTALLGESTYGCAAWFSSMRPVSFPVYQHQSEPESVTFNVL